MTELTTEYMLSNPRAYMRVPAIIQFFSIGQSTWWKWVQEGKAPRPIKIGPRTSVWRISEILALADKLENQVEE